MKLEFEFDSDEGNRRKTEGMKRAASYLDTQGQAFQQGQ
jgi:hypothetical protein